MPHRRLADLSTDHDLPVQRASLLSLMYLGSAILCLPAAFISPDPNARLDIVYGASGIGMLIAAVLWSRRHQRLQPWVLQGGVLLYSAMVAAVAAHAQNSGAITSLGPAVIMTAVYAGCFYTGGTFWLQVGAALCGYAAASLIAVPPLALTSLLTVTGVALALGIVLQRLTGLLRERTLFDSLTGAVSRATWLKIADGELRLRPEQPLTVAMIDLDKFKEINDLQGHLAGDELLRGVAKAWTAALGQDGLLGRYGGDEFVILFLDTDPVTARRVLHRLELSHPVEWTAGLAAAEPGDDLKTLLQHVDLDLRSGKGLRHAA